jgi:putative nucleotidyltransferase with HDIG domain
MRNTQRFGRRMWRSSVVRRALLLSVVYAVLSLVLFACLLPESVQLEVGQASPRFIGAPRAVQDRHTTEALRQQARQAVKDIFEQDPLVEQESQQLVTQIFEQFISVSAEDIVRSQKLQLLRENLPVELSEDLLQVALNLNADTHRELNNTLNSLLTDSYHRGIKEDTLTVAQQQLNEDINRLYISTTQKSLLRGIGEAVLRPNLRYNALATEQLRQEAESRVLPVVVQQGQKIIGQGEIATEREIALLKDLGLLGPDGNWLLVVGCFAYMLISLLPIVAHLVLQRRVAPVSNKEIVLLGLIILLTMALSRVFSLLSGLLMPVATAAVLITILLGHPLGIVSSLTVTLLAAALSGFDGVSFCVALMGAAFGAFSVSRMHQRFDLVKAGALVGAATGLTAVAFHVVLGSTASLLLGDAMRAAAGGVMAVIIAFGILPFLERPFGLASSVKLLELSNPNHPLLRRLLIEAPGTYNHSIVVANLAEAAAEAIGAGGLLARVGAYYHDVGKLKRPYFFVENQFGMENPHDKYPPTLSSLVITSHIKDGVEIGREYKLPQVVLDIIQQHHGTGMVSYFYHRAREQGEVEEKDFRYAGPVPQTKEAAIVMLADAVEAAVRSLSQPTPTRIDSMVRKIIKDRLNDGQLDECDITLRELDQLGTAFVQILSGIFHKRIQYPDQLQPQPERTQTKPDPDQSAAPESGDSPEGTDSPERSEDDDPHQL